MTDEQKELIVSAGGGNYVGTQRGSVAEKLEDVVMFNTAFHNSTLGLRLSELTVDAVKAKILESKLRFDGVRDEKRPTKESRFYSGRFDPQDAA